MKGVDFDFVPSSRDLTGAELELKDKEDREFVLKNALSAVLDDYDYIFIDCAPSINLLLVNALTASNGIIIPLQCEYFALEGMNQLLNTVRLVKKHLNPSIEIDGVLLTMCMRNKLAQDVEKTCARSSKARCSTPKYLAIFGLRKHRVLQKP